MYEYFLQVLGMWLLSIVKFIATPFVMIFQPGDQWSFLETILVTASGAACGAFIFFHFGELIFNWSMDSQNENALWNTRYSHHLRITFCAHRFNGYG
jgi:hypothetical protein